MPVYVGKNSFFKLIEQVKEKNPKRIFLVTGRKSFDQSPAKEVIDNSLENVKVTRFSDFSPNVKFEQAFEGCCKFRESGADTVVAIGGGSVIDMAKIISVGANDKDSLFKVITGKKRIGTTATLLCAPTTAGSGSEATHFAVVYIDGKKFSVANEKLLPHAVAVDPSLSASMSPYLTACTGFDALSQSIESYWAKGADTESRKYSMQSLALILPNIRDAVHSPSEKSRAAMAEGSYLAGKAINISKTTAPHAFSYYLTSKFSIAHGHAAALLLGQFFEINERNTPEELYSMLGMNSAKECRNFWYDLMGACALETNLCRLGVTPEHLEEMALSVNVERLGNNPVSLVKTEILDTVNRWFCSLST